MVLCVDGAVELASLRAERRRLGAAAEELAPVTPKPLVLDFGPKGLAKLSTRQFNEIAQEHKPRLLASHSEQFVEDI